MDQQQLYRPVAGFSLPLAPGPSYPLRESGDFNNTGRIMLVRQDDDDKVSFYESMHNKAEPSVLGDDRVNLV